MRETSRLVINTGPIIALVAALGDLRALELLYDEVVVPLEVGEEVLAGGSAGFAVRQSFRKPVGCGAGLGRPRSPRIF